MSKKKGFALIHGIVGVLWIAIITIYVLILFFPVSVNVSSVPYGAEVFVGSKKVGETPMKIHPIPAEGTWVTIFKVEHFPYCVEYAREYRGGIHRGLTSTEHYSEIEVGISNRNINYVSFIPETGKPKILTLDEHGGFFTLLAEELKKSEEDLKLFLMNCYSEKKITIKYLN